MMWNMQHTVKRSMCYTVYWIIKLSYVEKYVDIKGKESTDASASLDRQRIRFKGKLNEGMVQKACYWNMSRIERKSFEKINSMMFENISVLTGKKLSLFSVNLHVKIYVCLSLPLTCLSFFSSMVSQFKSNKL